MEGRKKKLNKREKLSKKKKKKKRSNPQTQYVVDVVVPRMNV